MECYWAVYSWFYDRMQLYISVYKLLFFMCVIPVVCVTNKEGGVVKQHN